MDTIPSKRRRITGSYSIPAGDPINTNADGYNDESQRRASYKAPTKASIARYNPNLLAERVSISTGDVKMDSATSSLRGPPRGLNPTALRPKMTAPRLSASPTRGTSSSPSRRIRASVSLPARGSTSARESGLNIEVAQADAVERSLIEEEKLVESVHRRGKRSRLGQTELMSSMTRNLPEPELPPTPAQLGLEPRPQSPVGVLSSSPRTKGQARKVIFRSSPLKPKSMPEEIAASSKAREPETSDQYRAGIPQEALKDNAKDQEDILDNDPEVLERRQRLDQLAKQLQMLQSDVGFLHLQIRRYQEKPAQGITQSNLTRLVNILTTSSNADHIEASPLKPTSLSTRLSSFLPFAQKPKPTPDDPLLEEEILPSYKPTEGPDPLSHLQAFTPFSITSTQRLTLTEAEGALLNQQQLLLSAPDPLNLDINLTLTSDTDTEAVEQLTLDSITPWADAELGTWIRHQAEHMADMAAIGWGSARYLDLALIRAKCWVKCHRAFPQHSSLTLTTLTSRELSDTADNGADDADDGIENDNLVPLLGKVSFRLESRISKAALQVTWHIDLDWIGDVESRVSATASLPPRWIERDGQRDSLSKIPKTFELLVRKVGVFEAIKVLVGLVLGT